MRYFNFFDRHQLAVFRVFFALILFVDLVFLYAVIFDRTLPPRIAKWFFGTLSGQAVTMAPSDGPIAWWQWLVFSLVSLVPPVIWIAFEMWVVPHR